MTQNTNQKDETRLSLGPHTVVGCSHPPVPSGPDTLVFPIQRYLCPYVINAPDYLFCKYTIRLFKGVCFVSFDTKFIAGGDRPTQYLGRVPSGRTERNMEVADLPHPPALSSPPFFRPSTSGKDHSPKDPGGLDSGLGEQRGRH